MTKAQTLLSGRTNEQLITDWSVLDAICTDEGMTKERAMARGWIMDEIEKRFPAEFGNWIENCSVDDNIENYITV